MIDSHAHIINEFYDDIDSIVEQLKESEIIAVVNVADSLQTSNEVLLSSRKYKKFLFPTAGIHPENIDSIDKNDIKNLEELIKENKFCAVGEIGLDYHWNKSNIDKQKELFIAQLNLAKKFNLPVVVHSREATEDTFNILKNSGCKGVVHCFSGSVEMAKEYVKLGFFLGIGGVLTFSNSKLSNVIEEISLDNILLETDSPFLSPVPLRGKQNFPSNVSFVAEKIASIKGMSKQEVISKTTQNAINLFDLNL